MDKNFSSTLGWDAAVGSVASFERLRECGPRPCRRRWRLQCRARCLQTPGNPGARRRGASAAARRHRARACRARSPRRRPGCRIVEQVDGGERPDDGFAAAAGDHGEGNSAVLCVDVLEDLGNGLELGQQLEVEASLRSATASTGMFEALHLVERGDDFDGRACRPRSRRALRRRCSSTRPALVSRRCSGEAWSRRWCRRSRRDRRGKCQRGG